jgi:lactosylceramide 4-alpha-galactosyltransferase
LYTEKSTAGIINNLSPGNDHQEFFRCPVTSVLLKQMNNIEIVRENLVELLEETPLWQLHKTGSFNRSSWRLFHLSDAARVALLWKKGGTYLDMDCIVLRPLESLNNTIGTVENGNVPSWVENGVMAFSAGHPFLHFLMKYMVLAFEPDNYISLGPDTLRDAMFYFCNRETLPANHWVNCRHNSSIFIQPPESFYAINNSRMENFYQPEFDPNDWDLLHRDSFLSHIYGAGHGRIAPPGSLYAELARKYCPVSYAMATAGGANGLF